MKLKNILFILLFIVFLPLNVSAKEIDIHLFYSSTCMHCKEEKTYLSNLAKQNKNVKIHLYEVSNKENNSLLDKVQTIIDGKSSYVPYTVIGNNYRVGFNSSTKIEIEKLIEIYQETPYIDVVTEIINENITLENYKEKIPTEPLTIDNTVDLPLLGRKNAKEISLPLVAIIMGLTDGFNPCAMWVLIFLMSVLINLKDKRKMWFLGSSFIITSALIYLLFMSSWLTITTKVINIRIIQIIISIVSLTGAFINIRSYLKSRKKESGCEVVNDTKRKKIINKIKRFTSEKSYILATLGVISLAISVNVVELACSLGLPVLFTNILAINNVPDAISSIYLLIYIFFYMLDDMIIFTIAMLTFKVTGITTKYTKYTHLIGGIIMLIIGLLLIFKPSWIMFNF